MRNETDSIMAEIDRIYVAIKELIEVDDSRIDNFIREMQIVARLSHKNVIKIHQAIFSHKILQQKHDSRKLLGVTLGVTGKIELNLFQLN